MTATPTLSVKILSMPGISMPPEREATPTLQDPVSLEVETATSQPLAVIHVFEGTPLDASPVEAADVTRPATPPPSLAARSHESTLLSAREAAVAPAPKNP